MEVMANLFFRVLSAVLIVLAMLGTFAVATQFDWFQNAMTTLSEAVNEGRQQGVSSADTEG